MGLYGGGGRDEAVGLGSFPEDQPPSEGFEVEDEGIDPLTLLLIFYAVFCAIGLTVIIATAGWSPVSGAAVGALGSNCVIAVLGALIVERQR